MLLRRMHGFWLLIHPFPIAMVVSLACILGISSARENFDAAQFTRALITLFLSQAHVGMTNDYLDRALDAQAQTWKPLARGWVKPNEARLIIFASFALMFIFALTLGPIGFVLALLGTFAGQIYNFRLRGTPYSWIGYVLGFSVLPFFIWDAASSFSPTFLIIVPIGIPLIFAAHLAQTLPDVESDRALGVFGFAATLGRERAAMLLWLMLIAAHALAFGTAYWLKSNLQTLFAAMIASFALVTASMFIYYARRTPQSLRIVFRLVSPSALILVAGWLAALRT
ncbi:MAG: UbiA family prenyltransferase [Chloroflexi bacterium]|nr:UbiA family prenyltransferase [Chloroflexota bacterium]